MDLTLLIDLRKKRSSWLQARKRAVALGFTHALHPEALAAYQAYSEAYCAALEGGSLGPSNFRTICR